MKEDEHMCKILNKYFSSVFTLERPEGLMELENRLNQEKVTSNLNKIIITEEIVYYYYYYYYYYNWLSRAHN